ncbi:VOC family protein [Novosphingobium sp. PS1R-30]|uniref:VOC family protein n=1 Tax=Novosphingobium anseongense TaxID=3133436 RepID=A0ABU8S1P1_9SPHN
MHHILAASLCGAAAAAWLGGAVEAQAQTPAAASAAAPKRGAVIGAAVHVSDLQRSLKFYRDALGMRVMAQFSPPGAADKSRPDTVLNFGNGPADTMLMLLSDRSASGTRPIEHGFGFARVVLRLPDLQAANASLRANGFPAGEIKGAHGTVTLMMLTDPDGYTVEVIQG